MDFHSTPPFRFREMLTPEEAASPRTQKSKARLHRLLSRPSLSSPPSPSARPYSSRPTPLRRHRRPSSLHKQHPQNMPQTRPLAPFPFFALPAELRREVYFYLLVSDDRLVVTHRGPRRADVRQGRIETGILLACKQCRDEGVEVLYGENLFDFEEICNRPISASKGFLATIGRKNASLIRIAIASYSAATEELSALLSSSTTTTTTTTRRKGVRIGTKWVYPSASPSSRSTYHAHNHQHRNAEKLTLSYLHYFLSAFGIHLPSLRVFAISAMPYGSDMATVDLLRELRKVHGYAGADTGREKRRWQSERNERLGSVVDRICEREAGKEGMGLGWLERAGFERDVDGRSIGFHWATLLRSRVWMVWKGPRTVVEAVEEILVEEETAQEGSKEVSMDAAEEQT